MCLKEFSIRLRIRHPLVGHFSLFDLYFLCPTTHVTDSPPISSIFIHIKNSCFIIVITTITTVINIKRVTHRSRHNINNYVGWE